VGWGDDLSDFVIRSRTVTGARPAAKPHDIDSVLAAEMQKWRIRGEILICQVGAMSHAPSWVQFYSISTVAHCDNMTSSPLTALGNTVHRFF